MSLRIAIIGTVFLAAAASAAAQQAQPPLAELARKVEAERAAPKKPARTYTNADLASMPVLPPPPSPLPPPGFVSATLDKPVSAEEVVKRSEEIIAGRQENMGEEHWRGRASFVRVQIEKQQDRLATLSKPNPDRHEAAEARNKAEIAKVQKNLDALIKKWDELEESAGYAKIPTGWLDPRPKR